jgi:hypothetical protein
MSHVETNSGPEVMQVCLNGHVITDRLLSNPDSGRTHCERCGASTIDQCGTCGTKLPGVVAPPDLVPIGSWPAPRYCLRCGAALPWVRRPRSTVDPLTKLTPLLRRLPRVIRELRWRQGDRPPFRVEDERDLEDLVRALLPLHFDDVRLETRTPRYSARTRTDLLLNKVQSALTLKLASTASREPQLFEQCKEDITYYQQRQPCCLLVVFIYDPEGLLRDQQELERKLLDAAEDLKVRGIVAG